MIGQSVLIYRQKKYQAIGFLLTRNSKGTLEMDTKVDKMLGLKCDGDNKNKVCVRTLHVAPVKADVSSKTL